MSKNYEIKTKKNDADVMAFINSVEDAQKKEDSIKILKLMSRLTQAEAKMWGSSIIGFGDYHYKYKSGREGDWMLTAFSPRKQYLTLYIMTGFNDKDLMEKLGKYKTGKSCLYIKKLSDINTDILEELITRSINRLLKKQS